MNGIAVTYIFWKPCRNGGLNVTEILITLRSVSIIPTLLATSLFT